ncbi:enoyl-CoA hydratase/isomerase family protein [Roseovarius sp.]|uniref:enoyl-CoA hydratase/isomerase family protein n=1 Tax=Roseovarius sp. TaxID=1486281 RepID=UPI002607788D|nr:enoyl-CoA hydratase/isomerase family protein [Roseovarius sp.]MDM8167975.1 enoyl-CoA hydratase/isomerase family protein [Roseovarius sp.]
MTDRFDKYQRLVCDRPHPHVLRVTMTNGKMNTVDEVMARELVTIWRDIDEDPSVHSVLVTGAGKVFSAGGSFDAVEAVADDYQVLLGSWKEARDLVYNILNCSKPVVSAMRGAAAGAGIVVGLLADVSIATKTCKLIDGHTRLGVAAGDHAAIIWPLLCGMAKAKYYLLTCDQLAGEEAERIGLLSMAVEDEELEEKSLGVAIRLADGAQSAVRWTKYSLNNWLRQAGPIFDTSLALEYIGFMGPEVREGVASFKEKRDPVFPKDVPL